MVQISDVRGTFAYRNSVIPEIMAGRRRRRSRRVFTLNAVGE
jgi:hypothetical protein